MPGRRSVLRFHAPRPRVVGEFVFQKRALSALAVLLVLAIVLNQVALALLCIALLLSAGLASLWSRWALRRVSYERSLSQERAFPGDELDLTLRLTNRKLLPLATLAFSDKLPSALHLLDTPTIVSGTNNYQFLQRRTALRWYESVVWHYRVRCTARGSYRIGPVTLESGDPFGLYDVSVAHEAYTRVLVYPQLLTLEELNIPARHPLGDTRARQLIRDPLRIIGVRDYAPGDPLKDVHWAATARTGTLQTRIYEETTARTVALFLDLDTFEFYYQGIDAALVERMISAAATLAHEGLRAGYAVGLYANGAPSEHEHLTRLPPGRSPTQLALIMDTLARLTPYSVLPAARLVRQSAVDLPTGSTLLLISAVNSEAIRAALLRQREQGRQVVWLFMGSGEPPAVPGVRVHVAH
ncbi:DUF58 domain-containing protein [Candidatus Gracilibacteria bacterium]|nr:DUF58 domain-containing protein [Candidatus Gracilibacteria bacterium]